MVEYYYDFLRDRQPNPELLRSHRNSGIKMAATASYRIGVSHRSLLRGSPATQISAGCFAAAGPTP